MIYLYGLLSGDACLNKIAVDALQGVTGEVRIAGLPQSGTQLIFGPAQRDEILPKRRFMLAHTRVLEAFLPSGSLLPMRFGMFASEVEEVASLVSEQSDAVASRMNALRGKVEVGLKVSFDKEEALAHILEEETVLKAEHARLSQQARPHHFKVAEFGRRLSETLDRRRTDAQKSLIKALQNSWSDHILRTPETDVDVLCADVLLCANQVDALAEQADAEARNLAGFPSIADPKVRVVGPIPAFNFVRLNLGVRPAEAA